MSTATVSVTQAMNTLNIVATQVQNLLNVHITKYVNTGDRVVDNGITLIVNSCIALVGAYLYSIIIHMATLIYNKYMLKIAPEPETDCPTDINIANFDYSKWQIDTIMKYVHTCTIQTMLSEHALTSDNVYAWILHTYKHININKQINYATGDGLLPASTNACINMEGVYMPIWKYTTNSQPKYEYIWIIKNTVYSTDYNALNMCVKSIYEFKKQQTNATKKSATSKVNLYQINNAPESTTITIPNSILIGNINPKKQFNSIFYDKKPRLLHVLNKFMNGTMYPSDMCDNKLGILLYGPPGTGKTGTITALANYTKRNIIMMKNTTVLELKRLKSFLTANGLNKYIIVFDEFDHILCNNNKADPLAELQFKEHKLKDLRVKLVETLESDKEERERIQTEIKMLRNTQVVNNNDDIGLGELLQFLDGIEDQTGRLIVATTNHPDKINPILLRPGRFDLKLELGYCSMQMFRDIAQKVFADDVANLASMVHTQTIRAVATAEVATTDKPASDTPAVEITQTTTMPMEEYIAQLLKKKITPLNLINSCLKATSFAELIEFMEELEPDTFTYSK